MSKADLEKLERDGVWFDAHRQSYTQGLIEDGRRWTLLPGPIPIHAPVRILQGGLDDAVPWRHALATAEALQSADVVFTLVKDGDHRLSRPQDIERLVAAVESFAARTAADRLPELGRAPM